MSVAAGRITFVWSGETFHSLMGFGRAGFFFPPGELKPFSTNFTVLGPTGSPILRPQALKIDRVVEVSFDRNVHYPVGVCGCVSVCVWKGIDFDFQFQ